MKREADFDTRDKLLAVFTYARLHEVDLGTAGKALGYDRDTIEEAVRFRLAVLNYTGIGYTVSEYFDSIRAGCDRLVRAN